jgi:hypothetical protein
MQGMNVIVHHEGAEEGQLSAEEQAQLIHLEELQVEADELAKPMLERMQARNLADSDDIIIARMGSTFSFR